MATELSKDEQIFVQRMVPHFLAGKSPAEAAAAVIEDDARLLETLLSDRIVGMSQGAPGDGSAMVQYGATEIATTLRSEIASTVYHRIRALAKAEGK